MRKMKLLSMLLFPIIFMGGNGNAQNSNAGGEFTQGPNVNVERMGGFQQTLPNGNVIIFGGHGLNFVSLNTADVWDSLTNSFTLLNMNYSHDWSANIKLFDGTYLLAGGAEDLGIAPGYNTCEIFNPTSNIFTPTGNMNFSRTGFDGAQLNGGKVLVVGAWYNTSGASQAELYDTSLKSFSNTLGQLNVARSYPLVIPTNDGGALIIGGFPTYGGGVINEVEYYNSVTDSFYIVQPTLFTNESDWNISSFNKAPQDYMLQNGKYVFLASRTSNGQSYYELFTVDPSNNTIEKLNSDTSLRSVPVLFQPVVNKDKNVIYFFSTISDSVPVQARLFTLDLNTDSLYEPTATFTFPSGWYPWSGISTSLLHDGRIMLTGGHSQTGYNTNFSPVNFTMFIKPDSLFTVGIKDNTSNLFNEVGIYPNPTNNLLTLELPTNEAYNISIFNSIGLLVYSSKHTSQTTKQNIDVSQLPAGVYMLEVKNKTGAKAVKRVVKF